MADINAGSFSIKVGGAHSGFAEAGFFIDFNQDGVFASTESISSDILSVNWGRGREPEEINTPAGSVTIVVNDPDGHYVPNSTFWDGSVGDLNVDIGREVQAIATYKDTTFALFRQRLQRLTPNVRPGNDQTATLFFVDDMEWLDRKIISYPNTTNTTGDDLLGKNINPRQGDVFGTTNATLSVLTHILDESSFEVARRQITQQGSTAEFWGTYNVSAKAAIKEVERHEGQNSMIFINSSGSLQFHSSTHRDGSTQVASFGVGSVNSTTNVKVSLTAMV